MTTTREKKGFDCVKTTRKIRDRHSVELAGTSPEGRVRWLNSRGFSDPLLRRLVNRLRPQEGREGEPLWCARPAARCPGAIPSAARREANDDDHGVLTAYREARKEDGVPTANSSHLPPRSQVVLALQVHLTGFGERKR